MYFIYIIVFIGFNSFSDILAEDNNEIPFETTYYTFKTIEGLSDAEMKEWPESAKAVLVPGAVAMKLVNEKPKYILTVGGFSMELEHGAMLPLKFLKKKAKGTCTFDKKSILCQTYLQNGRVAQLQFEFKGDQVILTRTTEENAVRLCLQKIDVPQSGRAIEDAASEEQIAGRIGARSCIVTNFMKYILC